MACPAQCITSANLLVGIFSVKVFFWCDHTGKINGIYTYNQMLGHNFGMSPFSSRDVHAISWSFSTLGCTDAENISSVI